MRNTSRRTNSGQAIIEFALVMPVLALIIVGIFDFGNAILANNMIENAARTGARAATIKANLDPYIKQRVKDAAPTLNLPDGQIIITPKKILDDGQVVDWPTREFDQPVVVTVQYTYRPITPFIGQIVGGGIQLTAKSTMIVEGVIEIP